MKPLKTAGLWLGLACVSALLTACPDEKAAGPSKEPSAVSPEAADKNPPGTEDKSGAPAAKDEKEEAGEEGGW